MKYFDVDQFRPYIVEGVLSVMLDDAGHLFIQVVRKTNQATRTVMENIYPQELPDDEGYVVTFDDEIENALTTCYGDDLRESARDGIHTALTDQEIEEWGKKWSKYIDYGGIEGAWGVWSGEFQKWFEENHPDQAQLFEEGYEDE